MRLFSIGAVAVALAVIGSACVPPAPPQQQVGGSIGYRIEPIEWRASIPAAPTVTATKQFRITSIGTAPGAPNPKITSPIVPGGEFELIDNQCGTAPLAPGASCTVRVKFTSLPANPPAVGDTFASKLRATTVSVGFLITII